MEDSIMKRLVASLLAASMLSASLVACGSQPPASEPVTDSESTSAAPVADDLSEKLTISVNVRDSDKVGKDARYDYIEEKFNVDFDFISCGQDVRERVRVWVAGDDMPDVMWSNLKINEKSELISWVEAGVLKEFPDLTPYPNLKAAREKAQGADALMVDGKDYVWTSSRGLEEYDNINAQGFYYRKDWAEKLGMAKDEYTWEEMKELARAFVEQDPGNNGAGNTIGIAGVSWAFPGFAGLSQYNPKWKSIYKNADGKYVFGGFDEATYAGAKELKSMYDEGILWPDQPLAKSNDAPNRFMAGQVGILYENFHPNAIMNMKQQLAKMDPTLDVDKAVAPMKVVSPDGSIYAFQSEDFYGVFCFNAKIEEKKMNRFLMICDWLLSEEGRLFNEIGIEGVDYKMVNGEPEILWEKDENGNYINPYLQYSDALFSMVRLNDNNGYTSPLTPEGTRDALFEQMDWYNDPRVRLESYDYDLAVFDGPLYSKYNFGGELQDKIMQLLMTDCDIEAELRAFNETMKPKVDKVLEEVNNALT